MKHFVITILAALFLTTTPAQAKSLTIAGPPMASAEQAVNFIRINNPNPRISCTIEEIVRLYYKEAGLEGIRPDVALSQALLETGFFRYGGDVQPGQNNFCGLGSVGGGARGASFATPELGVRAHIQHLVAYSRKSDPKTPIVNPRYQIVRRDSRRSGACRTWHDLDGLWAQVGIPYGDRILNIHKRMLATAPAKSAAVSGAKQEAKKPGSGKKTKKNKPSDNESSANGKR